MSKAIYLTSHEDGSNKFWQASVDGTTYTSINGKIGSNGQTTVKSFPTHEEAVEWWQGKVAEKLKKKYVESAPPGVVSGSTIISTQTGPKPIHNIKVGDTLATATGPAKVIAVGATPQFPRLWHKGKGGAMFQWDIETNGAEIITHYGQVDGKLQTASKLAEPKNVGRSNATTAEQQALLEAQSMHAAKLKRKYSLSMDKAEELKLRPMLAHSFADRKSRVSYPVMVQPKLDGFRCLGFKEDGVVTLYSRSGDIFNLPHISDELNSRLPDGMVVDGELYAHKIPFQTVASWIKKSRPESIQIGYHIYDVPEVGGRADLPMSDRLIALNLVGEHSPWKHIDIVETVTANSEAEVYELQMRFVADGFEGAIVRLPTGLYRYDYRSYDLLKVKEFSDADYLITGGGPGKGKMADQCIFECVTEDGQKFTVVPKGSAEERQAYLTLLPSLIGKLLKVQFFGKSVEGIPRFPVGLGVREEFDK